MYFLRRTKFLYIITTSSLHAVQLCIRNGEDHKKLSLHSIVTVHVSEKKGVHVSGSDILPGSAWCSHSATSLGIFLVLAVAQAVSPSTGKLVCYAHGHCLVVRMGLNSPFMFPNFVNFQILPNLHKTVVLNLTSSFFIMWCRAGVSCPHIFSFSLSPLLDH